MGTPVTSAGGSCGVVATSWLASDRDFDRATTIEHVRGLKAALEADRDRLKRGDKATVGDDLNALLSLPRPAVYVSKGVYELANRLRQLDCAVRAGRLAYDVSMKRFAQILLELDAEQFTLNPPATSTAIHPVAF